LPSKPHIFHGRDTELADLLKLFEQGTPRIAILGAGGMGKTSLARTLLHHPYITARYQQNRYFVACDFATTKVELAAAIGEHLGLKPGEDLSRPVIQYLSSRPGSVLILDNLETAWEPSVSRQQIEEFLSLLTDVPGLVLLITMRGAERPSKVQWTRPFLPLLQPLAQDAAQRMFLDIADDYHLIKEVDQVLSLTGNVPLVISLLAHLVDAEGCSQILSRWEAEKTSIVSDGHDRKSNLQLSIELSLSSPRITSMPHSQDLLSLLCILPDGLSDVELKQSKFPITDVLGCKAALLRTALAYSDNHKRLRVLVPIREYMQNLLPPTDQMITPLFKHFHGLIEMYTISGHHGRPSGAALHDQIVANYTNMQNILHRVLS
ncbi:P-loop containing nucleoside triphosphate hydrolase protein, partial [Mycena metata]